MLPPYIRKRNTHIKAFIKTSNVIDSNNHEKFGIPKNKKIKKGKGG